MSITRILTITAILFAASMGLVMAQSASKIILVSDNEADYAVAATVGNLKGFKVVTTPWGGYDSGIVDNIKALNPGEVLIIGGPAAVPSEYETALLNFTNTIRVAGKDRYATVARVLELFREDFKGKNVVAAYGYDKRGIEKAMEKAKAQGLMVVFVDRQRVPWEVQKALEKANISSLDLEEAPDMNTTEILDDVKDDVGSVRITSVDHAARAKEQIQDADEEILKAQETLETLNVSDTAPLRLLENARDHLIKAEKAYNESKYGEAFGLAVSAEALAKNAGKIAKDLENYLEESHGKQKELTVKIGEKIQDLREDINKQEEKASKAEAKGINVTEVRAYLEEAMLALDTAEAALQEGDTATAVADLGDARNLLAHAKVSLERKEETYGKEEEKEIEVEVKIAGGIAHVKVDINDEKLRFNLETTDKTQIISQIAEKTGLTKEQVESNIEFEGNHAELGGQRIEKKEKKEVEEKKEKKEVEENKEKKEVEENKEKEEIEKSEGSEESKNSEKSGED